MFSTLTNLFQKYFLHTSTTKIYKINPIQKHHHIPIPGYQKKSNPPCVLIEIKSDFIKVKHPYFSETL